MIVRVILCLSLSLCVGFTACASSDQPNLNHDQARGVVKPPQPAPTQKPSPAATPVPEVTPCAGYWFDGKLSTNTDLIVESTIDGKIPEAIMIAGEGVGFELCQDETAAATCRKLQRSGFMVGDPFMLLIDGEWVEFEGFRKGYRRVCAK